MFTGAGRRRRFTGAEKAAIVEESYASENSICGVARRHGLTSQQLLGWRRLTRLGPSRAVEPPLFVPAVVSTGREAPAGRGSATAPKPRGRRQRREGSGIELEIDCIVVRVGRDADAGAIAALIDGLDCRRVHVPRGDAAARRLRRETDVDRRRSYRVRETGVI